MASLCNEIYHEYSPTKETRNGFDKLVEELELYTLQGMNKKDPELQAIKARVKKMEEVEKLKELHKEVERCIGAYSQCPLGMHVGIISEADPHSIYVGYVDYETTAEELEKHFYVCGSINRVTILCGKYSDHSKGFAYVEFTDAESVQTSLAKQAKAGQILCNSTC